MEILEKHYQKLFRLEKDDFRLRALENLIIKTMPDKKCHILDLGCGSAVFSCLLAERGHKIFAIDPSQKMIDLAQKRKKIKKIDNKSLEIVKMGTKDLNKIKQKFDVILILDVLEHIKNDWEVLLGLKKILKKRGILIITVPAHPTLYGERDKEMGHFRRYSKKMLKRLIQNTGYKLKKMRYWNLLGFIVYYYNEKITHKRINEKIRYQEDKKSKIIKKIILRLLNAEKNINTPYGLTLLATAQNVAQKKQ